MTYEWVGENDTLQARPQKFFEICFAGKRKKKSPKNKRKPLAKKARKKMLKRFLYRYIILSSYKKMKELNGFIWKEKPNADYDYGKRKAMQSNLAIPSKLGKIYNRYFYWGVEEFFRRKVPVSVLNWSATHDGFLPHFIWSIICGYDVCDAFTYNIYAPKPVRNFFKFTRQNLMFK